MARTKNAPSRVLGRLSAVDRAKLGVETGLSDWTIRRWERGDRVALPNAMSIAKAARKLGIEVRP